jgi:hypothetical protein
MKLGDYVIIWTEGVPTTKGLAATARAQGGELLAAGPIHDVSERDSRAAPGGLVIARFGDAESAKAWFATTRCTTAGRSSTVVESSWSRAPA